MIARLLIDGDLCQGTGECAALAGDDVIEFDAMGIAVVVPPGEVADDLAECIIATCPSGAVSVAAP